MDHFHFSTAHVPANDRLDSWGHINRSYFGNLKVDSLGVGPLDAALSVYQVGVLRLFLIEGPAHRISRASQRLTLPTDDLYKLVLQLRGRAEIIQNDRSFQLHPGDWSLYDPRVPYTIANHEPCSLLVAQVPRQQLKGFKVPNLHTCEASTSSQAGLYAVLGSFLKSLSEQLPMLSNGVAQPISETVLGLLASTLANYQDEGVAHATQPSVLKARVKQYVQTHLSESDLTIDRIALDMRCSKRYLHRVFEDDDWSLDRYIWLARLERCRAALSQSGAHRKSISEIAFAWGFNSSAHFCRLFKTHFQVSPGEFQRHAAHAQAEAATRPH